MVHRGRHPLRVLTGAAFVVGFVVLAVIARDRFSEAATIGTEVSGQVLVAPEPEDATVVASTAPPTTVAPARVASTIAPTTTETLPPPRTATLAFTGDTLAHRGVVRQAEAYGGSHELDFDFSPMFAEVAPYLTAADLAICHLETPLSPDNSSLSGYPTFNVPGDLATALASAGYDGCSTASNHSLDRRDTGVVATLDVLDSAGLGHTGMARSDVERSTPRVYDAGGIDVANLSYSYGFNGFRPPADKPWLVNEIDVDTIAADAAAARASGAEFVVASLHWGTEYRTTPNEQQLSVAERLLANEDIDVIIGHHAHVVQPVGTVAGKPVVYGLGNFLSNQSPNCCEIGAQDGVIMQVHIEELADRSGFDWSLSYVPTRVDRSDFTIVPLVDALEDPELGSEARTVLEVSRARTRERLASLGADAAALTESPPRG